MGIRDASFDKCPDEQYQRLCRKANQEWGLAGCARQDGDDEGAKKHTECARQYERQKAEYLA